LPVENGLVGVVISNRVINLAPDKSTVFNEAHRVLKKGGRMYVSDIFLLKEVVMSRIITVRCFVVEVAGFEVKILHEDKGISESQYGDIALESLKLAATKKS
jgi:arsenite methyltransferase